MPVRKLIVVFAIGAVLLAAGGLVTRDTASAGELTGELPATGGVALVNWSGGATSEIVDDADARDCRLASIWTFPGGVPVGYLVGAPDFVNGLHLAHYPGGEMPAGPILAVCAHIEATPTVYRDSHFDVQVTRDVIYGQGLSHSDWGSSQSSAVDLTLDVYQPTTTATSARPVIVLIHGGGFDFGSSQNGAFVSAGHYFASRGWVAFSINYRLSGEHGTVPNDWASSKAAYVASRDAKAAVRWIRAQAGTYDLDTNRITAQGGSAGGILALMLGATNDADYRDELTVEDDWTLATTNLRQSARVATVVDHWGSLWAVDGLKWADGISRIDPSDAPTIIFHGTEDNVVPYAAGIAVRDAYQNAGIPVELHPLPGAGHSPWDAEVDGRSQSAVTLDFIAKHQNLEVR